MKLIIAGSRDLGNKVKPSFIQNLLIELDIETPHEIVSGGATGIDSLGERYAADFINMNIIKFPADWNKHGRVAGPIRNAEMAKYADSLLLIWDGTSKGSLSMKNEMLKLNKPIYEVIIKK